jgi:hypothetical protein
MSEQDRVTCPFCDAQIHHAQHPALTHQTGVICPLLGFLFSWEQWAMRPPKKEAPQGKTILSEVEWLRQMVAALTIEPEPQHYAVTYPSNISQPEKPEVIYASREGTAK